MQKRSECQLRQSKWLVLLLVVPVFFILSSSGAFGKEAKGLVDVNTASEKELEGLKGVGPATAKKIIENRPYNSVDELSKAGISAKKIEALKPFVTVGPASATLPPAKTESKPGQVPTTPQKVTPQAAPATQAPSQPAKATQGVKAPAAPEEKAVPKLAPGEKVNINTASKEMLEALPGIGPVKAQAIIDGRPYSNPEDIMKVKGIKQGTFSKIKDHITVK